MSESDKGDKGEKGDTPSPGLPFTPQDALAFMQRMWNPFGVPIPGFAPVATPPGAPAAGSMPFPNPAMMFAALDPKEVEKKIDELRVIESWLSMSLSLMQMSIRTLELQKASLEALSATHRPAADASERSRGRPRKE
jgi:hypothetical protein